jgi:thiamine biosynthesis lipoprotein
VTTAFRAMGCEVAAAEAPGAAAVLERYERTFSRFRPDSELVRVNQRGGGRVSALFAEVLETALWAAEETGGLVDPTVGAAVVAAGYDRDFGAGLDRAEPARTAAVPGWRRVRLRGRALVLPAGCALDLNGVVKALAVDDAARGAGPGGFVSAGGDLATRGAVDVALPAGGAVSVDGGLATSGTTRRTWMRGGERQHHLVDPRTGRPARTPWSAVTVCGATCLAADVAAKAALLLGADGPPWLEARGLPGRFVAVGGTVTATRDWERALACT